MLDLELGFHVLLVFRVVPLDITVMLIKLALDARTFFQDFYIEDFDIEGVFIVKDLLVLLGLRLRGMLSGSRSFRFDDDDNDSSG